MFTCFMGTMLTSQIALFTESYWQTQNTFKLSKRDLLKNEQSLEINNISELLHRICGSENQSLKTSVAQRKHSKDKNKKKTKQKKTSQ